MLAGRMEVVRAKGEGGVVGMGNEMSGVCGEVKGGRQWWWRHVCACFYADAFAFAFGMCSPKAKFGKTEFFSF